jgi:hypothetical protein
MANCFRMQGTQKLDDHKQWSIENFVIKDQEIRFVISKHYLRADGLIFRSGTQ